MPEYQVRTVMHSSSVLGRSKKRAFVLVPQRTDDTPLPICYYLHGWGGNGQSYLNHRGIADILGRARQVSVFPESFRNWFINDHQGNRYEDYLIDELVPTVERELDGLVSGSARAISGFSMGGLSALCLAFRHPHLFRGIACFAAAFEAPRREGDPYAQYRDRPALLMPSEPDHTRVWGEPGSSVREQYDPYHTVRRTARPALRIYMSTGTKDFDRMIGMNRRFHQFLNEACVELHYEEYEHGHDMELVAASLRASIEYIHGAANP